MVVEVRPFPEWHHTKKNLVHRDACPTIVGVVIIILPFKMNSVMCGP